MTALTASRQTPYRSGDLLALIVAASKSVFMGGMAAVNVDGESLAATNDPSLRVVGVADKDAGPGESFNAAKGIFAFTNSIDGDALTKADIGQDCFAADDQTVAKTSAGGTRPRAGKVFDVDEYGVWVDFRETKGARKMIVQATVDTLVGANVYRAVAPVDGVITKVVSIIEGVLTTGDATLTTKIGATPVTDGVITITQAGSAAGDIDSAVPTANNNVTAGQGLSWTVGGTNATASKARVYAEITY